MSIFGVISFLLQSRMVEAVNKKLHQDDQLSLTGWYYRDFWRLKREYRRLYPGGTLGRKMLFLWSPGVASLLIAAWNLGGWLPDRI